MLNTMKKLLYHFLAITLISCERNIESDVNRIAEIGEILKNQTDLENSEAQKERWEGLKEIVEILVYYAYESNDDNEISQFINLYNNLGMKSKSGEDGKLIDIEDLREELAVIEDEYVTWHVEWGQQFRELEQ